MLIFGIFYFCIHPRLSPDIVKIECQWLFHHPSVPFTATTDRRQIGQIAEVIRKGRPTAHPFSKLVPVAAIKIRDASGREQGWTLYKGGTLGEWGTGWDYHVGMEIERRLKDAFPLPVASPSE